MRVFIHRAEQGQQSFAKKKQNLAIEVLISEVLESTNTLKGEALHLMEQN